MEFHEAFINASSRILYREDWALSKPDILKANGWEKSYSEVLVSTPRRFGKTFRRARRVQPTKRCLVTRRPSTAAWPSSSQPSPSPARSRWSSSRPHGALPESCWNVSMSIF